MVRSALIVLLFFISNTCFAEGPFNLANPASSLGVSDVDSFFGVSGFADTGGSIYSVLDVTFEGATEAARLKNLVDNSDPTTADGATNASSPCSGSYDYDTGGSVNQLIYSISNFDPTGFYVSFDFKMPTYISGDYVFYVRVDADNYIWLNTAANSIQARYRAGGTETAIYGSTLVNDSACHTVEFELTGGTLSITIDSNLDDSDTVAGTWAGTVDTVYWGIEWDDSSGCDCLLDNLVITDD